MFLEDAKFNFRDVGFALKVTPTKETDICLIHHLFFFYKRSLAFLKRLQKRTNVKVMECNFVMISPPLENFD